MDLSQYDNQCIRIVDRDGNIFDGYCSHNSEDYDEHEFGRCEESLQIVNFLFFPDDIRSIESLEGHTGPYGHFLDPYGTLEEMNVQDGMSSIDEALDSEDPEHVLRMLRCLDAHLDAADGQELPWRNELPGKLRTLVRYSDDDTVRTMAQRLLGKLETGR